MAKIWPVYEGKEPTRGGPWAEISFSEAIRLFDLRQEDFISGLDQTPRFGDKNQTFYYRGYKHVVVEVDQGEARREKWQPGFYRSSVSPEEAFGRLLKSALASALGEKNLIRVQYSPAVDSRGEDALLVTAVIDPNAVQELESGATLDALVKLRERLREMQDERTPIVEYATEAELAQNAGH